MLVSGFLNCWLYDDFVFLICLFAEMSNTETWLFALLKKDKDFESLSFKTLSMFSQM